MTGGRLRLHPVTGALAIAFLATACGGAGTTIVPAPQPTAPQPTALQVSFIGEGKATSNGISLPARDLWNWSLSATPDCLVTAVLDSTKTQKLGYTPGADSGGLFNLPAGTYVVEVTDLHRYDSKGAEIAGAETCSWGVKMSSPQ
jgi:hypothetical protein